MLVDMSGAQERERRMGELLNRLGSLDDNKIKQLEKMVNAQQLINNASDPTNSPLGAPNDSLQKELSASLAGRSETLRLNMTQILGFTPTDNDVKEISSIQSSFGGSLSTAASVVAKNINSIEGGVSSFLQAVDTGITGGIVAATNAAGELISKAQNGIIAATKDLLPDTSSIFPTGTLNQLKDVINDANSLTERVSNMISSQIESTMKEVDGIFNSISDEIAAATKSIANSNIISDQAKSFKNAVNSLVNSPPTSSILPNADNQQPPIVVLLPPTDVSSAPITLPRQ